MFQPPKVRFCPLSWCKHIIEVCPRHASSCYILLENMKLNGADIYLLDRRGNNVWGLPLRQRVATHTCSNYFQSHAWHILLPLMKTEFWIHVFRRKFLLAPTGALLFIPLRFQGSGKKNWEKAVRLTAWVQLNQKLNELAFTWVHISTIVSCRGHLPKHSNFSHENHNTAQISIFTLC